MELLNAGGAGGASPLKITPKKQSSVELVLEFQDDGTVAISTAKLTPARTPKKKTPKKTPQKTPSKKSQKPDAATPLPLEDLDLDLTQFPEFHTDGIEEIIASFNDDDLGVVPLPDESEEPPPPGTIPVTIPTEVATPEVVTTEVATHDSATPKVATHDSAIPKVVTHDSATPEVATTEVATHDSATPEVVTTEVVTHDSATPEVATTVLSGNT